MANTHSISLNGSSQYLTAADSASLSVTGDMTIEGWFKFDSSTANTCLLSKYEYTGNQRSWYLYGKQSTGVLVFGVFDSGTTGTDTTFSAITLTAGTWYHLAISYSAAAHSAILYVNGTSTETKDTTRTSIFDSTAKFGIGVMNPDNDPTSISPFDGLIDEVRVWNDIRTQTEIQDNMYVELAGTEDNLQAYWKLNNSLLDETSNDNDLTNVGSATFSTDVPANADDIDTDLVSYWTLDDVLTDSVGSNDLTNNGSATFSTGKINNGISLNGTDQYLSAADSASLSITGNITIETWIKANNFNYNAVIIGKGGGSVNNGYALLVLTSGKIMATIDQANDGSDRSTALTTASLSTGTWYHLVMQYTASTGRIDIFINGNNQALDTDTANATAIYNNTDPVSIGASSTGGNRFNGLIDEGGIWSRALTPDEVLYLYQFGDGIRPFTSASANTTNFFNFF